MAKQIGSAKARKTVKQATARVLKEVKHLTPTLAAEKLGLGTDDMRNMRQGTAKLSVPMLLKMVRRGYDPASIVNGPTLWFLPGCKDDGLGTAVKRKVQQRYLDGRVRKLAWTYPGKELAKLTGLSVTGAYGLRYGTGHITLYTLLGFLAAGHRLDELVFGARL
ncbi:MAG: hypothetical protein V3T11_09990 [Roseateles sp.]